MISTVLGRLYVLIGMSPMSATIRDSNGAAPVAVLYGRKRQDSALICLGPNLCQKKNKNEQNKSYTKVLMSP